MMRHARSVACPAGPHACLVLAAHYFGHSRAGLQSLGMAPSQGAAQDSQAEGSNSMPPQPPSSWTLRRQEDEQQLQGHASTSSAAKVEAGGASLIIHKLQNPIGRGGVAAGEGQVQHSACHGPLGHGLEDGRALRRALHPAATRAVSWAASAGGCGRERQVSEM